MGRALFVGVFMVVQANASRASRANMADFQELKGAEPGARASALVKLSYMGPQDKPVPSIGLSAAGYDVGRFEPFHRPGLFYGNDRFALKIVTVSEKELSGIFSTLTQPTERLKPPLAQGRVAQPPFLSVSLLWHTDSGDRCFEAVLSSEEAKELFVLLRGVLERNRQAQRTLQSWGCALDLLTPVPGKDVTALLEVSVGGFYQERGSRHFKTRVGLKNISARPLPEPLSLAVIPKAPNVRLVDADGTTCRVPPPGLAFVNIPLPTPALAPGETVETILEFENPDRDPIRFETKVIAGPIER